LYRFFELLKRTHPARFFWTGMAVAQLVTLVSGVVANLALRGRVSGTSLLIGASIAFVVSSLLGLIVAAFVQRLKRAEEDRRASEERYRALVEHLTELIYRIGGDLTIQYLSPAVTSFLGYRPEELVGRSIDEVLDEEYRAGAREALSRALAGEPVLGVVRLRTRDGSVRWARGSALPLCEESGVLLQGVLTDITEEKRAERQAARLAAELQQAQRLEAVGTLAGGVAHDFNNLLAGIIANSSLLGLADAAASEQREAVQNIEALVKQGSQLTRQLLGFARRGNYEVVPSDLNQIVHDTARLFERTKRELALHVELDSQLSAVEVDRTQIGQVLLNLLVNAAAASPAGGSVWVRTRDTSLGADAAAALAVPPGRYATLAVEDHGAGMDEATRRRVFEPFFTTRPEAGTGLGLASAYGIVTSHRGALQVESTPGQGSTFTVYLPRTEKPVRAEPATVPAPHEVPRRGTILLVDDEEYVLRATSRLLVRLGHTVLTARNGRAAIALYRERGSEIGLVILDLVMPELGGAETFDALRELDPSVRVLLSSGYSIEGQAQEVLARGCAGFLQKPYDATQLNTKVRELMRGPGAQASAG
jgi:PAS domain S-box-containing protein